MTDYQIPIFYLALISRKVIPYLIDETQTDIYSYREKGHSQPALEKKEEHHNIAVVKSTLNIPPQHSGTIQIKIKGHNLRDQVAYFISNQHTKKGLNPNIHVIDDIYNIKGKLTPHTIVANYTNKHITFSKGQCIGPMEPPIDNMLQTSVNSVITQKMMDELWKVFVQRHWMHLLYTVDVISTYHWLGNICFQLKVTYYKCYITYSCQLNGPTCLYICLHCITIG